MTGPRLPRLDRASLQSAAAGVMRPGFDLDSVQIGVVHLGLGAFARAHQFELYERRLAAGDLRWGVCGVSLRRPDVRDALAPQDGLYTLVRLGAAAPPQVMGALRELLVASETPAAVLDRLASPSIRVVALTVTEKGYHLDADGELAFDDPSVMHDLEAQSAWRTPVAWLAAGLRRRWKEGAAPFLTLSCDNLSGNGSKLKRAVLAFLRIREERALADWTEAHALFPDSMVDSITPATDEALRDRVATEIGLDDAWPVQREAFTQWVVEDVGHPALDELSSEGLTLTPDVAGYERAKLRLLNGAHSALAYLGLLAGLETVGEAMRSPRLATFVGALLRDDLAPTVRPPAGLDVAAYIDSVLARFRNPDIRHRLSQIAADGSVKLPVRLLHPAEEILRAGSDARRIAVVTAAWMRMVVRAQRTASLLDDPASARLLQIAAGCSDQSADVDAFLARSGVFSADLSQSPVFRDQVAGAYVALGRGQVLANLR